MSAAIVTGSGGLIGAEAARFLASQGMDVHGVDSNLRSQFFGPEASTRAASDDLAAHVRGYRHHDLDIRNIEGLRAVMSDLGASVSLIVHAAGQPSHEWAARDPLTDFAVNATGTLHMLQLARQYCQDAVFIFTSSNRVYGDTPNRLPLRELETRWEIDPQHAFFARGIDESMSVDQTIHSLMGASKLAADVMVQEYGRYFGLKTGVFRCGCLTGPHHAGAEQHGFLAYLMKCAVTGRAYRILGYGGKQVRDNMHGRDLVRAMWEFYRKPRPGEVYNVGGGRASNCSLVEAIALCERIAGQPMKTSYVEEPRRGDHIWWISDVAKFMGHYPAWRMSSTVPDMLRELYETNRDAWAKGPDRQHTL